MPFLKSKIVSFTSAIGVTYYMFCCIAAKIQIWKRVESWWRGRKERRNVVTQHVRPSCDLWKYLHPSTLCGLLPPNQCERFLMMCMFVIPINGDKHICIRNGAKCFANWIWFFNNNNNNVIILIWLEFEGLVA